MLTTFVDPVIVPRNVDVVADRFVIVPVVLFNVAIVPGRTLRQLCFRFGIK